MARSIVRLLYENAFRSRVPQSTYLTPSPIASPAGIEKTSSKRQRSSSSGIGVGVPIHEIAPRTPHRSHIQEDGTIQLFRPPESRRAPRVPIHRLRNSPLEVRRIAGGEVVQFLLRWCGSRPGHTEKNRPPENHSYEPSDRAGGNKFQSASLNIQKVEPLLIAERPEIRL